MDEYSKNSKSNTSRLAKNTIILYVRLTFTMLIALFTSRIVLNALGVEDYGLYNVIGGVVTMLSIVTSGLITSTQRYLSFELGNEDRSNLRKVFSMCFTTHILLACIALFFLETIGLWLVNNSLRIPEGRYVAANWIYQFSIVAFFFQILVVPYSATVISHERMSVYAYIGIFDAAAKLLIAYVMYISSDDRLVLYSFLMMFIFVMDFLIYKFICNRDYEETKYKYEYESKAFREILSFSSWTMLGQGAMVFCNQGLNVLINIFHSVIANAALGIAQQVNAAITSLTSNFFTAFQPQIIKSYSAGDLRYFKRLICLSSKVSFFMIFLVSLPIMINIEPLLNFWLGVVPPNTALFCCVFVLSSIVNSIGNPFWTAVFATGWIKKLQILSTILYFLCVLVAYVFLKYGSSAIFALIMKLITDIILTGLRIMQTQKQINIFTIKGIMIDVIVPIIMTMLVISIVVFVVYDYMDSFVLRGTLTSIIVLVSIIVTYFLGLCKSERNIVNEYVIRIVKSRMFK